MGVDPGRDRGTGHLSTNWSGGDTDIDVAQSFCLLRAFEHMILWCNAIIDFSLKSEAYTTN